MKKFITIVLASILGTICLFILLAVAIVRQNEVQNQIFTPTVITKAEPDPARDHRVRAAGLMVIRLEKLTDRIIAQCRAKPRLAPPDCEKDARTFYQTFTALPRVAAEGEVQFMKLVDLAQRFEREEDTLMQILESK